MMRSLLRRSMVPSLAVDLELMDADAPFRFGRMVTGVQEGERLLGNGRIQLLVADDDEGVLIAARMLFGDEGWQVNVVRSIRDALRAVETGEYDVALVDMNYTRSTTVGEEGLELLERLGQADPDLPVVVMTAWATVDLAVDALKRGARDFVQKPWNNERVLEQVKKHAFNTRVIRRERLLQEETRIARQSCLPGSLIACSDSMREVMEMIEKVAPSEAPVLLLGENGTGKSLLARWIHERSLRKDGPFISVNMGGLAEGVFESEVFGHVKGAFTDAKSDRVGRFELAKGGSLFMDEIGNMSAGQQNRLLRVMETGEFERVGSSRSMKADVRVISATNAPLKERLSDRSFREDLYYRLNTVTIELPPLRDRRDDILPLAHHFLGQLARRYKKRIETFTADAERLLLGYGWPGNLRELSHSMERAVLMCQGERVGSQDLRIASGLHEPPDLESMSVEDVERLLIEKALRRNGGNVTEASRQLGMSRATFYRRLQSYGL